MIAQRMRFHSLALAFLGSLAIAVPMAAQTTLTDVLEDPSIQLSRPADRARVVAQMGAIESARRQNARDRAALRGLPLRTELPSGRVQEIADFDGDRPLYLTTDNVNAAISTGANLLRTSPYSLSGAGVTIGLWDGGSGRSTHQEFDTRLTVMDGAVSIDHATHVGGTLIASGVSASARGMASSAVVDSYDWNSDTTEMTSRGATYAGEPGKIYLSNHSYNYVGGWNYVNSGSPTRVWEWYGAGTSSTSIEADFGVYNTYARDNDALCFNAPYYLVFRSAGNDRTDNPSAGQVVALSPGSTSVVSYDPAVHPGGDGNYRGGFDTIGYNAISKNVITIGSAADAVTGSTRDVSKAVVSSFSSWGPTDDGRIKPDVVANGENLYSSLNGSNSSYGTYSGTSMATPNAVGSASLLIQQFGNLFPGQAMRSSTLKGLLIHTADDRGNVGPDYKYGWGMVNVQAAADLISDHFSFPAKQRFTENQVTSSTVTRTLSFVWDGVTPIWATLCWTDPAGTATSTSDFRTSRLVNNLNLKIIAPNGTEFLPYVMPFVGTWSQASMDSAATTGVNNTDNVEQVRIATPPAAGTYQAVVSYTGTLTNSSQNYSLLVSGSSTEVAPPPPLSLASVSPNSGLAGAVVTLDLSGTSLSAGTTVKLTRSGQSDIAATGVQLIGSVLRCQVNLAGAAAGAWNVVATNANAETSTLTAAFTVVGAIWSQNFDGAVTGWASDITTGTNSWALVTTQSQSPTTSYFAAGPATKSTTNLTSPTIPVPAGATNLQLKFWHSYNLQSTKDAGKLEFSIDNGAWFDVLASGSGAAFASNGYNATISSRGNSANLNQFSGQSAWSGNSNGFVETIVNLTDTAKYAGKNLRIRWRIATDSSTSSSGWYVDSIALLGGGDLSNQAPVINTAATTSSSETVTDPDSTVYQVVRSTSTNLSVAATDDAGESALIYTWSVTSGPAQLAFFTANSSNAAKATTVNFEGTGDYQITVSVRDSQGLASTSAVNVRVLQTASGLIVSPAATTVSVGAARSFSAALLDQFSVAMVTQPSSFVWSANAGGSISSSGLFTASTAGGPYVIGATSSGFSNSASVTVTPLSATVTLGNLSQTYDGSPKIISVTTNPPGLAVAITYNGSAAAASNPGSYAVEANITDPNYQGSASGTLLVGKATATVALGSLLASYDGSAKSASATTSPSGLTVDFAYDGSETAPTNAGTYAVVGMIRSDNYTGSASGSLVIGKANATVTLGSLSAIYDGSAKSVSATTSPGGLTVDFTYDGSETAPTNAGTYAVVGTIRSDNYMGSARGSLVIGKAAATVMLGSLSASYDGSAKSASATTSPSGLTVDVTYDGSETAPTNAGTYAVVGTIRSDNYTGSASGSLVIGKAAATVTLGSLSASYDGSAKSASATTSPSGLTVDFTYDGSATAPTNAGTYAVVGMIRSDNYTGSASGSLVIGKAAATVTLGSLSAIYDGSAKSVSATTSPSGLTVDVTYDGSETAPTNAGTYAVVGTIRSYNYMGSASGSLVIGKAAATVMLGSLSANYDGSAKSVSATTSPGGLTVDFTYDSSETAPTNAGTYAVVGTIRSDNYTGSASGSLVIDKATATVVVTELSQTYDGSPKTVTATTTPSGLSVSITYGGLSTAPTEIGYYEVVATVSAANYAGSGAGTLVISAPKGWLAWCNEHFSAADQAAGLAAENADPDFDDWKNLAEYALGTDPRRFNPPLVATKDSTSFSLTFTRPANLLDVTYGAESSQNLSTWSSVPLELLQTGDIETLRARVLINSGNPLLRFLRLRFVRPDP